MPDPSPIESAFWEAASQRIPNLEREVPIGPFRVDFLVPHKKVVVELYGYAYHGGKEKQTQDAQRERYLQKRGYQVVRFTGQDVYRNVHKCVDDLLAILATVDDNTTQRMASYSIPEQTGPGQLTRPGPDPVSSPMAAPVGPRPTQRTKTDFRAWQWAVLGGLALASMIAAGLLALMVMTGSPINPASPSEAIAPTPPHTPAATQLPTSRLLATPRETTASIQSPTPDAAQLPTPPLLSADSELRVTTCAYSSSAWKSVIPGRPITLTPPAGAVCGIFNFTVSAGETPTIIFNNERYTDLGSCLYGCTVYIRAVPVTIDVQGLTKPNAEWHVSYYWNRGP